MGIHTLATPSGANKQTIGFPGRGNQKLCTFIYLWSVHTLTGQMALAHISQQGKGCYRCAVLVSPIRPRAIRVLFGCHECQGFGNRFFCWFIKFRVNNCRCFFLGNNSSCNPKDRSCYARIKLSPVQLVHHVQLIWKMEVATYCFFVCLPGRGSISESWLNIQEGDWCPRIVKELRVLFQEA